MKADQLPSASSEERLDAIITEYLESVESGESSEPGHWIARYPDLATDLERFFAAETRIDSILAPLRTARVGSGALIKPVEPRAPPLRTIKEYELLAEIGRGGMGIIYKARQRSLNRLVAIKMIRSAEWATPSERMRFRWEAEAIAALDHPNIIPVYEIGEISSEDGTLLPFFSMKLIEGSNLAQDLHRFRNDWKVIGRLMILAARAVDHAHQRGILHRDLKPANILLGYSPRATSKDDREAGNALILGNTNVTLQISDFGLAAKTQQRGQTVTGTIVGTPAYLAPELTSGKATATIATDVYALGAILYEMLTGEPPFKAGTPIETIRMLTTTSIKAPRKVNPSIPFDLETICLKCLRPDPQNRYGAAGEFADDLERYLSGRSIAARPVGTFTAFKRWCKRNPWIAALSVALILSASISLPLIVWNWQRAVEHERIANIRLGETLKEREQANSGFELAHRAFEDLFRMIGDYRTEEFSESEALNKELLERGFKYYNDFVDDRRDDPVLRRELASAMFRIAAISQKIKTHREALAAYDKAIEFMRAQLSQDPNDAAILELLARSLSNRGNVLGRLEQFDEAIRSQEDAAEVWLHYPKEGSSSTIAKQQRGIAIMNRGNVYRLKGDQKEALLSLHRAKDILVDSGVADSDQGALINCLINIAETEAGINHLEEADRFASEAKDLAGRMLKAQPNALSSQFMLAQSLFVRGKMQIAVGKIAEAKASLISAKELLVVLNRAKPRTIQYKRILAYVCNELARIAKQQKNLAETIQEFERAVTHLRDLSEWDGEVVENRFMLAGISLELSESYLESKNYSAAAKSSEESLTHFRFLLSRRPSSSSLQTQLARSSFLLGVCYGQLKRFNEALEAVESAAQSYRTLLRDNPESGSMRKNLGSSLGNTAILLRLLSRPADAITVTEERMKLYP
ncbi:MAG TPA: protein kinase, partial [Gemmata sp.]|nr:protein kinase [Gemmata sp.]